MFFQKKFLLNKILENNPLFEYNMGELKNASDPVRKGKAKSIFTHFEKIYQGPDGQARTVWRVPSQNTRGLDYTVTLALIVPNSSLFDIAKRKWDPSKFSEILKGSQVKVHCTCPDFLWGGEKYNLGSGKFKGALEPKNSGHKGEQLIPGPANVKDPGENNILCKHCIAVADRLGANSFNIMKMAKDFKVNIKTNPELTKQEVPLKKDIEMVDLDKERTDKIVNNIYRGYEETDNELNKDTATGKEESDIVNDVVEPNKEETGLSKDKSNETESDEVINDVMEEPKQVLEKSTPVAPKQPDIPGENIKSSNEPKKVDSNLNPYNPENELSKDNQTVEENNDIIEDVLDKSEIDEEDKLSKDKNMG